MGRRHHLHMERLARRMTDQVLGPSTYAQVVTGGFDKALTRDVHAHVLVPRHTKKRGGCACVTCGTN